MANVLDVTGQKFARLTVTRRAERKSPSGALWVCLCDCGNETVTTSLKLRIGHTTSCGCAWDEIRRKGAHVTHGQSKTSTYRTWKEMRNRCLNANSTQFKWYGGRGITICDRWSSFENFLADMGPRPIGMTLDRICGDGPYSPDNCRWATPKMQAETNRGVFKKGMVPWNKAT